MSDKDYFTRLAAAVLTAAIIGTFIVKPDAGEKIVDRATTTAAKVAAVADGAPMASRPCPAGEPVFTAAFANIEDVISVSPLGGIAAPGEVRPAPFIRVNMRPGETAFERRTTDVFSPAKADIVAMERIIERDSFGRAQTQSWRVHFRTCDNVAFTYDRLDQINRSLLVEAGGLESFSEIGGPDHIARETLIRVKAGDQIGHADGFNIALHDENSTPTPAARPERYSSNSFARAAVLKVAPSLLKTITPDIGQARCALDYLSDEAKTIWSEKLGDAWGLRKAKGENACRAALVETPDALQGSWYTDASHNAATTKISAIALSPDTVDPDRMIMALHGRLRSLSPALISLPPMMEEERTEAAGEFVTFTAGDGRINTPFKDASNNEVHCYERLRVTFIGPRINGVILMQRTSADGAPDILTMEARGDALTCDDLEAPWSFSKNATTFYR